MVELKDFGKKKIYKKKVQEKSKAHVTVFADRQNA